MIAHVSPGHSSADHSLNTLRYADRLKDRAEGQKQVAKYGVPEELMGGYQPEKYLARPPSEKKSVLSSQENKQLHNNPWELSNNNRETDKVFRPRNENVFNSKDQNKNGTQTRWYYFISLT